MSATRPAAPPILAHGRIALCRSLRPADAGDDLLAWFADPAVMAPVNVPPRRYSKAEMRAYIAGFDNRARAICGIFPRALDRPTGAILMEFAPAHRNVRVTFLAGERSLIARRAFLDILEPIFEHGFRKRGVDKICANVTEGNEVVGRALARHGFVAEGVLRQQVLAHDGARRLDQTAWGLLKSEWRARRG